LIDAAHTASGSDNITIVIADVDTKATPTPSTAGVEPTLVAPKSKDSKAAGKDMQSPLPISRYTTSGLVGAVADIDVVRAIPGAHVSLRRTSRQVNSATKTEKARYTPRERRSYKGLIAILIGVVLALALAACGVYAYASAQYFVSDASGRVAIYQGLDGDILGLSTSRVVETTNIALTDLPFTYRDKVTNGIHATSGGLEQAQATVATLKELSAQCIAKREDRPSGQGPGEDGC
ncbi:MAG: hypothetical protein LBN10_11800, partial [Propionibacteriaceae bacterium]|nr:hypothetical protein [Propionibacteriaceae bacterium]